MHNIKVRKEMTKAEPHTFKSSFSFKLENETNENDTTTTNDIAQNTQTMCPIKECKLTQPSDTQHNNSFLMKKQTRKPHTCRTSSTNQKANKMTINPGKGIGANFLSGDTPVIFLYFSFIIQDIDKHRHIVSFQEKFTLT